MKKLFDLEPAEVSLVPRGANKRKFLIFKSRGGNAMTKETEKSLASDMEAKKAAPAMGEADASPSAAPSMSDKAIAAAKAIQRIYEPFKEELGPVMAQMFGADSNDDEDGEDLSFDDEPATTPATPDVTKDDEGDDSGDGGDEEVEMSQSPTDASGDDNAKGAHMAGMEAYQRAVKNHATKTGKPVSAGKPNMPIGKLGYQKYPTAVETQKSKDGCTVKGEEVGKVAKADNTFDALSGVPAQVRSKVEMIFKSNQELIQKNEELSKLVQEERQIRREREFIAKANGYKHFAGDRAELAKTLMTLADSSPAALEVFERNLSALSGQSEAISKGLFREVGSSLADNGTSIDSKMEAAAAQYVAKSGEKMSKEQAYDRFLQSTEGQRMYSEYAAERRGIVE